MTAGSLLVPQKSLLHGHPCLPHPAAASGNGAEGWEETAGKAAQEHSLGFLRILAPWSILPWSSAGCAVSQPNWLLIQSETGFSQLQCTGRGAHQFSIACLYDVLNSRRQSWDDRRKLRLSLSPHGNRNAHK